MRPDPKERAALYIASPKTPRAIAGQGGDKVTYSVACTLAVDFALDDGDVRALLEVYNTTKCEPRWGERDIERFVRSARKTAQSKPGEVGKLINVDKETFTGPRASAHNSSESKPAAKVAQSGKKPPTGQPNASATSGRTRRTPFFECRRAGEGAELRCARTFRTDIFLSKLRKKEEENGIVADSSLKPSGVSGPVAAASCAQPPPSVAMLCAIHPSSLAEGVDRSELTGDRLRLYDGLLRNGPMTRERLIRATKWTDDHLTELAQWLTSKGFAKTIQPNKSSAGPAS